MIDQECSEVKNPIEESIAKTTFYINYIYNILKSKLPVDSIVLQPAIFDYEDGKYKYKIPDNDLPASIRIDFMAYVKPVLISGAPSYGTTLGDRIFPIFAASVNGSPSLIVKSLPADFSGTSQPSVLIQIADSADTSIPRTVKGITVQSSKNIKMSGVNFIKLLSNDKSQYSIVSGAIQPQISELISQYNKIVKNKKLTMRTTLIIDSNNH